jgi:type VI secretion system protein ImpL
MPTANMQSNALKEQFASAWHFLKNNNINDFDQNTTLLDLPWYLMIGPKQAGKTQLIVQSQFDFIPAPHLNIDPHDESDDEHRCNWWFTRKMTFLDVPGHYLVQGEASTQWQLFLTNLKPYLQRKPLNGIILTLDLVELGLLGRAEQKKYIQQLRETIYLLSQQFTAPCPLYLLLTKVDRVIGFNEFFADLGKEERAQICGINLVHAPKAAASSLPRLFKTQFEALIKRLQERVIWRLHHERNANKRVLITQFPIQLESFGANLANVLYHFADIISLSEKLPLQGIYFVSSLQHGLPVDCLRKSAKQDLVLPNSIATLPRAHKQQTYFSQQLFHNIAANTAVLKQAYQRFTSQDKLRLSGYIVAVTMIMSSGLLMANNFNQRVAKLNAAQTALARFNVLEQQLPPENPDLGQTLPALNTLREATQLIAQTQLTWISTQARKLSPLAIKTYHTSLTTYFLPNLSTMLEHALSNSVNPDFTYGALKVYLMLGDPSHLDRKFVKNWFTHYWQQLFANNLALQQQLNEHLAALLDQPFTPVPLDQNIVKKTRSLLANTSAPQLAYAIIKSQLNDELINPVSKTSSQAKIFNHVFQSSNISINSLYTNKFFADVYLNRTLTASNTLLKGDWVLGATPHKHLNSDDLPTLVNQVRVLYLQDYASQWQTWLNNIKIIPWQNGAQIKLALSELLSRQSPFIRIIKTVNDNTNVQALMLNATDFTQADSQLIANNLSSQFTGLSTYMQSSDGKQASGLSQTLSTFKDLQDYLAPISKANPANKDVFLAALARFNTQTYNNNAITTLTQLAEKAPEPLRHWFNMIANNSWQLVLNGAAQYINLTWQQQVLPFYQNKLNNRYPLLKTSTNDISFADFRHFFGNTGILNNFFTQYLAPFLDTSHAQWQWQVVDGQTLNLASTLLPQLERAAIIRSMFFNSNDEFKVPFTLKIISFEPGVTGFTFKLGNQLFTDNSEQAATHDLLWPSKGSAQDVTLAFTDNTYRTITTNFNSPWALFHVIDKSNLQQLNDTQHYQLTFDYNGNAARYELNANKPVNPFISGIIEQFQCPASLQ